MFRKIYSGRISERFASIISLLSVEQQVSQVITFADVSFFILKKNSITVRSQFILPKERTPTLLNYGNLNVSSKLFRFESGSILVVGIQQKP